jgi:hypothetical protein
LSPAWLFWWLDFLWEPMDCDVIPLLRAGSAAAINDEFF